MIYILDTPKGIVVARANNAKEAFNAMSRFGGKVTHLTHGKSYIDLVEVSPAQRGVLCYCVDKPEDGGELK